MKPFVLRSYPEFITRADDTFTSSGGKLSHPDSNVAIIIDKGVVPEGVSQWFFFGVVYDETLLLRDFPETLERTLISPVIQCGPEDISLSKPVEIVLPHCLYVDEVSKKTSISVYRCGKFSDQGNDKETRETKKKILRKKEAERQHLLTQSNSCERFEKLTQTCQCNYYYNSFNGS